VPQLLLPDLIEGLLTSYRVAQLGAGKVLHPSANEIAIQNAIGELLANPAWTQRARASAQSFATHEATAWLEGLASTVETSPAH
jgi:UDP:flavonoid glycosyltransferase YjiC (YdhE family)